MESEDNEKPVGLDSGATSPQVSFQSFWSEITFGELLELGATINVLLAWGQSESTQSMSETIGGHQSEREKDEFESGPVVQLEVPRDLKPTLEEPKWMCGESEKERISLEKL